MSLMVLAKDEQSEADKRFCEANARLLSADPTHDGLPDAKVPPFLKETADVLDAVSELLWDSSNRKEQQVALLFYLPLAFIKMAKIHAWLAFHKSPNYADQLTEKAAELVELSDKLSGEMDEAIDSGKELPVDVSLEIEDVAKYVSQVAAHFRFVDALFARSELPDAMQTSDSGIVQPTRGEVKIQKEAHGDGDLPVLSPAAATAYEVLLELPSHRGLVGPELVTALKSKGVHIEQSTLTSRIVPELKAYGLETAPRKGYRIPASKRPN